MCAIKTKIKVKMPRVLLPLILLFFAVALVSRFAHAESLAGLDSAIKSISDLELKKCMIELRKKAGWQQIDDVRAVKCHSKKISSVNGLEDFKQIQELSLHNNELEALPCNKFPQLKLLNVAKNNIEELKCERLTHLEKLYIFTNQIKSLQLIQLGKLEVLKANNNAIETFSHQDLNSLNKIYLFNNKMETMIIEGLPSLKYMDVRENPMPDELYEEMDKLSGVTVLHDGNAEDWN